MSEINTAVSPEAHPHVASSLISDHVADNDPIVTTTYAAIDAAHKTLSSIAKARTEIDAHTAQNLLPANPAELMNRAGLRMVQGRVKATTAHQALVDAGTAALDGANARLDAARGKLDALATALDEQIGQSLKDMQFGGVVASETRTMLRAMPDSERVGFVMQRAQAGDLALVAAVLTGPAYLAGLTEEQRTLVRETAATAVAPSLKARRDAARKAQTLIDRAGFHTVSEIGKLGLYADTGHARIAAAVSAIA